MVSPKVDRAKPGGWASKAEAYRQAKALDEEGIPRVVIARQLKVDTTSITRWFGKKRDWSIDPLQRTLILLMWSWGCNYQEIGEHLRLEDFRTIGRTIYKHRHHTKRGDFLTRQGLHIPLPRRAKKT
jgi:hypothetical protein